jgi:hypothetical protein
VRNFSSRGKGQDVLTKLRLLSRSKTGFKLIPSEERFDDVTIPMRIQE